MVFQCIAKLVESLASPATSFATKQAEMLWQWSRYRSGSEEVGRGHSLSCWKPALLEMSTEFSADKVCHLKLSALG